MEILENKKKELEKRAAELAQKQKNVQQDLNEIATEMVRLQGAYREVEAMIKETNKQEDGPDKTEEPVEEIHQD
jgi:hypothetical protein